MHSCLPKCPHPVGYSVLKSGGETGIRTLGTLSRTHAFQACALSRSAISPATGGGQYHSGRPAQTPITPVNRRPIHPRQRAMLLRQKGEPCMSSCAPEYRSPISSTGGGISLSDTNSTGPSRSPRPAEQSLMPAWFAVSCRRCIASCPRDTKRSAAISRCSRRRTRSAIRMRSPYTGNRRQTPIPSTRSWSSRFCPHPRH
jgi:hypothetical protein